MKSEMRKFMRGLGIGLVFALVNLSLLLVWHSCCFAREASRIKRALVACDEETRRAMTEVVPLLTPPIFLVYLLATNVILGVLIQVENVPGWRRTLYMLMWMAPAAWYVTQAAYAVRILDWSFGVLPFPT